MSGVGLFKLWIWLFLGNKNLRFDLFVLLLRISFIRKLLKKLAVTYNFDIKMLKLNMFNL